MSQSGKKQSGTRAIVAGVSLVVALLTITLLSALISPCDGTEACKGRFWGDLLLDRSIDYNGASEPGETVRNMYPATIQNLMWVIFFVGIGELGIRAWQARGEEEQLTKGLLPEDAQTMLRAQDLGDIYAKMKPADGERSFYLQSLIIRSIFQFQSSKSISQTNTLINSSMELYQHEIDLKYSMLRYVVWLIPTLGFIGTVIGITLALSAAGDVPPLGAAHSNEVKLWMQSLTSSLGVAFYTTLLALVMSAFLVFILHIVQAWEEMALNKAGQYCLDNLVNRLYET